MLLLRWFKRSFFACNIFENCLSDDMTETNFKFCAILGSHPTALFETSFIVKHRANPSALTLADIPTTTLALL